MEKKIERVPYISKWYKEEQKDELLHFAFDEQNSGSDWDVDNAWSNTITTTANIKVNDNSDYHYYKPINPTLKFEQHLTQQDVDYLRELIHVIHGDIDGAEYTKSRAKLAHDGLCILYNYLINSNGVRDKAHEKQLEELIKQSKSNKSYEGTLGEHWKELMDLFDIKSKYGINSIKDIDENCLITFQDDWGSTNKLHSVFNKLGLDFIKDFIKVCEKCED